jgi:hypothetical protein
MLMTFALSELGKIVMRERNAPVCTDAACVYGSGGGRENCCPMFLEHAHILAIIARLSEPAKIVEDLMWNQHGVLPTAPFDRDHQLTPST